MSSQEVGTGYVSIVPSFKGGNKAIEAELGNTNVDAVSKKVGNKFTGGLKRVVKFGLAGGALLAGITAKKGLDRLMGIEDARASLDGLGHDAKTVDKIMANALKSVRGTAFGLADAGKVAASAVAAGVKPGRELTKNLRLVADAATIAKVPLGEMGAIFNKVAASNKIQGDVIAQLNDQGIPIIQLLSKQLGVSAEETVKLASKGAISFKTFSKAMQAGLGGAALKSGATLRGSFANTAASLGRIGANFLSGVYPKFAKGFQGITSLLGPLEAKAGQAGAKLADVAAITWDRLSDGAAAIKRFFDSTAGHKALAVSMDIVGAAGDRLRDGYNAAADALGRIKDSAAGLDLSNIDGKQLGKVIGVAVAEGLNTLVNLSGQVTKSLGNLFGKVNWGEIGRTVGKQVPLILLGLATGILNFDIGPIFQFIGDNWFEILIGVLTVAFAPAKAAGAIAKLLERIPFVGTFLGWIVRSLNDAGGKVLTYVADFFKYIWKGFKEVGPVPGEAIAAVGRRFLDVVKGVPKRIGDFLDLAKTGLGVKGLELAQSIGRGLRNGIGGVARFVGSIPGRLVRALGKLTDTLFPGGSDFIGGLLKGARKKGGALLTWVRGIPGRVLGAIGDLSLVLYHSGMQLIGGLISGIEKKVGELWNKLGDITKKFPLKKGPPSRDRKLLTPSGQMIMAGLIAGLAKGESGLDKYLAKVTKAIGNALNHKKISKAQAKAMTAVVKHQQKLLTGLATKIGNAQAELADRISQRADLKASIKDNLTGELDLGSLGSTPGRLTFQAVAGAVSGLGARVKAFAGKLKALLKAGIPPALVQEVAALGTVAGSKVADALLSGSSAEVGQLRTDFAALNDAASQVGAIVAGGMFDAGIAAQQGLIKGLLDDKAITQAAGQLANKLTAAVRKALGIRSPSLKMRREVGRHLPTGIIDGIDDTSGLLDARMRDLVRLPGLPDMPFVGSGSNAGGEVDREYIYTDTGMLLGWIERIAGQQARLVWAAGADELAQDLEAAR